MTGTVYLVGAGPGDPGLLTLAGRDALAAADIVFYDALAHPALLDHCSPTCERVFVGKRADKHFVTQDETNARIVAAAEAGKTVVRLKGGDPLVFGRGGEEAAQLAARRIPFVFVPGITSAIAAPTYAGIPVTHRDAASSFAVITGHERGDRTESTLRDGGKAEGRRDWSKIAHAADTLLFLMGVESLDEITQRLIEQGRAPETPVALVQWGTWPRQRTVTGTLADIVATVRREGITAPAVTVIGDVVRFRETLRWFDTRPLFGQRVLVTRAREQASTLSAKLRALGAEPIELPTIRIVPPADSYAALDDALVRLSAFEGVVFASTNAVAAVFARLAHRGRDTRAFAGVQVVAVGPATADALLHHGLRADFQPSAYGAEAIAAEFPEPVAGKRFLLPGAVAGREVLAETWEAAGAQVERVAAYQTVPDTENVAALQELLTTSPLDAITFTSGSTVTLLAEALAGIPIPTATRLVCIGPTTAQACREHFREPDAIATESTLNGLVATLLPRDSAV